MKWREMSALVAASLAVIFAATLPGAAANLLANGDFETGPYGYDNRYIMTGWTQVAASDIHVFDGIFDATWNVPPPSPNWLSNFGPHTGTYYLGRYYGTQPITPGGPGLDGMVFQQITGLTPGATIYGSCWVATHLPNGGGVRLGFDTDYVVDPLQTPPPGPTPTTVWVPAVVNQVNNYAMSEGAYSKIQGSAPVGASGNMTIWVQYKTAPNNIADVQIVQVDDVRAATDKCMEIKNIMVQGTSDTIAKVIWDTYDGDTPLVTNGNVDYGLTSSYGSNRADTTPRFDHSVNLTGLVNGQIYHYRINSTASGYENGQTVDLTFKMIKGPSTFSNIAISTTTNSATVSWDTDVASDSTIEYGYKSGVYLFVEHDDTIATHHSLNLTNLLPNTPYYFRLTSCTQPPDGCRSITVFPNTTNPLLFVTEPGPFWNGDFEIVFGSTHTETEPIPGWTKADTGGLLWFPNLKWSIATPNASNNYVGAVTNGGQAGGAIYQRFATTPGETLSYAGWVWSEGVGIMGTDPNTGEPAPTMYPHRFGEQYCQIGIDPTGGIDPLSSSVIWSGRRQTVDWHEFWNGSLVNIHGYANWQKVGVAAVAQGTAATIFLRGAEVWPAGWNFLCFDNIGPEPFVTVNSVAEAKSLGNDVAIDLAPAAAADCPVVTYIANPNDDGGDNNSAPYFYIQDPAQPAAIKVTMAPGATFPSWLAVGKKVKVQGTITWGTMKNRLPVQLDLQYRLDKACGERVISALSVTDSGATGTIEPVGVGNKDVAAGSSADHWFTNPGAADGVGVNTTGVLVKTWGRVLDMGETDDLVYYLIIDDGTSVPAYSGNPAAEGAKGLCVMVPGSFDPYSAIGKYVAVTGIAGVKVDFDWQDPSYVPGLTMPEAGKNVRWLKPLLDESGNPNIVILD